MARSAESTRERRGSGWSFPRLDAMVATARLAQQIRYDS